MQINLKKSRETKKGYILVYTKVVITETLNNMFLTISRVKGHVILKASIGQVCQKAELQLRKTPLSAELLGKYIGTRLRENGFRSYSLIISKKITRLVKSAIKGITLRLDNCRSMNVLENISHNGVRLRAKKRK